MNLNPQRLAKLPPEKLVAMVDHGLCIIRDRLLLPLKSKRLNLLDVVVDHKCQMAGVYLNGEDLLIGNFWDFHPGCEGGVLRVMGYLYGPWRGYTSLVEMIQRYVRLAPCEGSWAGDYQLDIRQYNAKWSGGRFINRVPANVVYPPPGFSLHAPESVTDPAVDQTAETADRVAFAFSQAHVIPARYFPSVVRMRMLKKMASRPLTAAGRPFKMPTAIEAKVRAKAKTKVRKLRKKRSKRIVKHKGRK